MIDIAPILIKAINEDWKTLTNESKLVQELLKKIADGSASFKEASAYASETSKLLTKAYQMNLSSAALPDGKMYFNIADRVVGETLTDSYKLVSKASVKVQAELNKAANIGLKAIEVPVNKDRIKGIVERIASEDVFDDAAWVLDDPVETLNRTAVFDTIKTNMDFQAKSGLPAIVKRIVMGNCCDWCKEVAGTYTYPDVPDEIYRGHDNCRCYVDFDVKNSMNKRELVLLQKIPR